MDRVHLKKEIRQSVGWRVLLELGQLEGQKYQLEALKNNKF
jgi:hypothetical protein